PVRVRSSLSCKLSILVPPIVRVVLRVSTSMTCPVGPENPHGRYICPLSCLSPGATMARSQDVAICHAGENSHVCQFHGHSGRSRRTAPDPPADRGGISRESARWA